MASMGKLYPPVIANTIPAFYEENGTVKITVPFSMSRAVSKNQIEGFQLKVKTAQSNTFILSLHSNEVDNAINTKLVSFYYRPTNETNVFKLGLFYKFQLAYVSNDGEHTVGYFSTVAVGKYTSHPNIYIQDAEIPGNETGIAIFKKTYLGVYELNEDQSERPYSYNFYLYDANGLVEESGWQLHNTTEDDSYNEKLQLAITADKYTFKTTLKEDVEYYIQYGVRTINNLEIFSKLYSCIEPSPQNAEIKVKLIAENIFEEGYINLSIEVADNILTSLNNLVASLNNNLNEEDRIVNTTSSTYTEALQKYKYLLGQQTEQVRIAAEASLATIDTLVNPVSVEICRSEKTDNYQSWILIRRVYFSSYTRAIDWSMKDFTIEQGITYKYCIREYNKFGIYNQRILSEPVVADFEDMFLFDGKRQLKVRFNPKMSSFKATKLEQKLDTIGNKYPFIFKNGVVDYKEFPISGLISYKVDNNELFVNHMDDLNIILGKYPTRSSTPLDKDENDIDTNDDGYTDEKSWELIETLDSVGYNIRAERRFKLKVLEWLNNSEVKLFRTPTEGSYLVRLMNISMSPEDRLGRMLHTFSCQAYEVDELNYDNLLAYGFFNLNEDEITDDHFKSTYFCDCLPEDHIVGYYQSFKINKYDIYNYLRIYPSPNTNVNSLYLRIGSDSVDSKTLITGQKGLTLQQQGAKLPDIYFNASDNYDFFSSEIQSHIGNFQPNELENAVCDLFGGINMTLHIGENLQQTGLILDYEYLTVDVTSGDITYYDNVNEQYKKEFVRNIYVQTITKTVESYSLNSLKNILNITDRSPNIGYTSNQANYYTFNKVFGVTFYKKQLLEIEQAGNNYYLISDTNHDNPITLDENCLYYMNSKYYYCTTYNNLSSLVEISNSELNNDINNLYKINNYRINTNENTNDIFPNGELLGNRAIFSIDPEDLNINTWISTNHGLNFVVTYQVKIVVVEAGGS